MKQLTLQLSPQPREPITVDLCCRECDAETTMSRINAAGFGWSDFVYERNVAWTWYDFSAVCPRCRRVK